MIHQNTHWERRYLEKIHVHTVRTCDSGGAACPDKEREEKLALLLNKGYKKWYHFKTGVLLCFPYCTSLCKAGEVLELTRKFIPTIKSNVDVLEAQEV